MRTAKEQAFTALLAENGISSIEFDLHVVNGSIWINHDFYMLDSEDPLLSLATTEEKEAFVKLGNFIENSSECWERSVVKFENYSYCEVEHFYRFDESEVPSQLFATLENFCKRATAKLTEIKEEAEGLFDTYIQACDFGTVELLREKTKGGFCVLTFSSDECCDISLSDLESDVLLANLRAIKEEQLNCGVLNIDYFDEVGTLMECDKLSGVILNVNDREDMIDYANSYFGFKQQLTTQEGN